MEANLSNGGEVSLGLLKRNIALLRSQQPVLAEAIEHHIYEFSVSDIKDVRIAQARDGAAVPVWNGNCPLHSLDNPLAEGEHFARASLKNGRQNRVAIFGFGFGYEVAALIRAGLSPIVYEPSVGLLKLALSSVDLTQVIPFATFTVGNRCPDLPRNTLLMMNEGYRKAFPALAQQIESKVIRDFPSGPDSIEKGVYFTTYRNVTCLKHPCDLVVYQMLFDLVRPTLVLEVGTCRGGSALYFGDLLRTMGGDRRIHSYDIVDQVPSEVLTHPNITCHTGGWTDFDSSIVRPEDRVLVIEDSSHTYENTLAVMERLAPFVTRNSYLVIEDGADGVTHPEFNGGPLRAIEEFLPRHPEFEVDRRWETFYGPNSTACLSGFLHRI